ALLEHQTQGTFHPLDAPAEELKREERKCNHENRVKPDRLIEEWLLPDCKLHCRAVPVRSRVPCLHLKSIVPWRQAFVVRCAPVRERPIAVIAVELIAKLQMVGIGQPFRREVDRQFVQARRKIERRRRAHVHAVERRTLDPCCRRRIGDLRGRRCSVDKSSCRGKPRAAIFSESCSGLRRTSKIDAASAVAFAKEHAVERNLLPLSQRIQLLEGQAEQPTRCAHPDKSSSIVNKREYGIFHLPALRADMPCARSLNQIQSARLGSCPHVSGVIFSDRQHVWMGKTRHRNHILAIDPIETSGCASKQGAVSILAEAGDELAGEQELTSAWTRYASRETHQSGVSAHPERSLFVSHNRADCIAR